MPSLNPARPFGPRAAHRCASSARGTRRAAPLPRARLPAPATDQLQLDPGLQQLPRVHSQQPQGREPERPTDGWLGACGARGSHERRGALPPRAAWALRMGVLPRWHGHPGGCITTMRMLRRARCHRPTCRLARRHAPSKTCRTAERSDGPPGGHSCRPGPRAGAEEQHQGQVAAATGRRAELRQGAAPTGRRGSLQRGRAAVCAASRADAGSGLGGGWAAVRRGKGCLGAHPGAGARRWLCCACAVHGRSGLARGLRGRPRATRARTRSRPVRPLRRPLRFARA